MPDIEPWKLKEMIEGACRQAYVSTNTTTETLRDQVRNSRRSIAFVKNLNRLFRQRYEKEKNVTVASATLPKEFLFDISVWLSTVVQSPERKKDLSRIESVHWQIESEMSDRSEDVLYDLNKLAAGNHESSKLYIVRRGWYDNHSHLSWIRCHATSIARPMIGDFYMGFIPHPNDWCEENIIGEIILLRYDRDSGFWTDVSDTSLT